MRRSYIENYYNAMDTVIQLLDNSQTVPSWKETRYKKMLDVLKIKSTEEFDMLYTIDMSYLFFSGPYRSRAKRWMTGYRPILNGQRKGGGIAPAQTMPRQADHSHCPAEI